MTAPPISFYPPNSQFFPDANNFGITGPTIFNNINTAPFQPINLTPAATYSHSRSQPRTNRTSSRWAESEVYARHMLLRANGYPLWRPKLNNSSLPLLHRQEGVRIGDIGIITDTGGFDYLFNICHDASHPLNEGRVPEGFKPLQEFDSANTDAQDLEPGYWIPNHPSSVHLAGVIPHSSQNPHIVGVPEAEVGAGLSFVSSASKGALLVLPEGGQKVDHMQRKKFEKHAAEHAHSWYNHAINTMAREAHNSSLYLVTGYDKTRAWGVSAFEDAEEGSVSMDFVPKRSRRGRLPEYWFPRCNSAVSSSGTDDEYGNQSGCVFLRGFKIAVRESLLFRTSSEVTYTSDLNVDKLLPTQTATWLSMPWQLWSNPLRPNLIMEHGLSANDIPPSKHVIYHPSDVINHWLLDNPT
ncbi:hypothetical protein BDP27DRAFT_295165 [Rhodocollybia butyracea]|uniref:Uncharacterized protein n=1 Tax=Rhodocollybia butyracea TaxID=206335 RepID=A0A9P5PFL5_9AGAR|nr:hypothetical protein BDP27DRAFT_295165 [Rhodocollybia butyracea]